ncbi:macro domain-containing protein [Lactobacillus psittaci]|uniref:ADP-ribose binding protein n=1 Tax=Lactobacillus psittaci DSM 15354 TaxID=1122152 RepID=A0A0R1S2R7_9LACO|nr:macro domain-containing protein [Lactobacillus psittaci]KRL61892.1 ADP-ribose binding protein [Lactobacillus psittaci DSM 15354]
MDEFKLNKQIYLIQASVVTYPADVIVNAANSALAGGGGVDGAIHQAAGPQLAQACQKLGGCKTGMAKITPSFNLKTCKAIIHAVGPVYRLSSNPEHELASTYLQSLKLADEHGFKSIAFCSISTGVYGFPIKKAAEIALTVCQKWIKTHPNMKIIFCCYRQKEYQAYRELV